MPSAAVVLATVHLILQIGFISVTVLLLFVTVVNRIRVRHVLLSWRTGKLLGLPVWPTVFLGAVLLFFGSALTMGQALPWTMVVGYVIGGGFWFIASLLSSSVMATEYGLIYHPNRAGHAVAWGQIIDYFDDNAVLPARYVFFYLDPTDVRRRLELTVPRSQRIAFQDIVHEKLEARFDLSAHQVYGKKALEG